MPAYTTIWAYQVREGRAEAFERLYGRSGAWVSLFGAAEGYLGTELLRDRADPLRYVTIDTWTSEKAWQAFRDGHTGEYEALDRAAGELFEQETRVGGFGGAGHPVRRRHSTGTPWEPLVGYSRAVRVGDVIHVSGTTATEAGGRIVGVGDPGAQTRKAIDNIQTALRALGSDLEDVVRTRIYVVDIRDWERIGRVHGERFGEIRPTTSMVEVRRLITPEILVEIEAEAIAGGP